MRRQLAGLDASAEFQTPCDKLPVEHVEFNCVNARIVWIGVNRRMLGIAHFCLDFMAAVDLIDDPHDGCFLFRCRIPGDVAELLAVFRHDVEPGGVLWDIGVLFEAEDGSRFKRFALDF